MYRVRVRVGIKVGARVRYKGRGRTRLFSCSLTSGREGRKDKAGETDNVTRRRQHVKIRRS
jgi:hypothetical protein